MRLTYTHPTDNTTQCNLPMVECPHCHKTFQFDDYYDIAIGDQITCQLCEKEIIVELVDTVTTVQLGIHPADGPTT